MFAPNSYLKQPTMQSLSRPHGIVRYVFDTLSVPWNVSGNIDRIPYSEDVLEILGRSSKSCTLSSVRKVSIC